MEISKNHVLLILILVSSVSFFSYIDFATDEMTTVKGGLLLTTDPITQAKKEISIKTFRLDKNLVTVADFDAFTKATGYKTDAEKFGNGGVFDFETHQWLLVDGADYHFPFGKNKPKAEPNHPVTQISWNDAKAYAQWKHKRLPTQWEWEQAAKNGSKEYTWGDDLIENGKYKANTWQGSFPFYNSGDDGFLTTSPVGFFGANQYGLTDMGGNVWQWCEDSIEPQGRDAALDPAMRRVTRGGSFLCDPLVCHGFRVLGRSSSTPESSMVHIGFRCAKDL